MKNMKNIFLRGCVLFLFALSSVNALAQTKISGTVKDASGAPVIGAVVMLDGNSAVGSVTDVDGKYTITIPAGTKQPRLKASCIGYADKTLEAGNSAVVDFTLSDDAELLDEVVVVGYGSMRKSDLTGSVTSVKIDDSDASRSASMSSLLQGHAAGVHVVNSGGAPDAGVSVRIRGISSFNGSSEPIYVVDGIIINSQSGSETLITKGTDSQDAEEATNGLMGINPQDIASIEVLKDASATAIYGALGANGVILITTKTGTKERPSVNFSAGVDVSEKYKYADILDLDEFAQYYKDLNQAYFAEYGREHSKAVSMLNSIYADPERTVYKVNARDWQKETLRTAISQRYYFAISGRPKDIAYNFTLGFQDRKGIITGTGVKLYSGRLNLDKNVNKKFKFGTKFNFGYTDSQMTTATGGGRMTSATSLVRSMRVYRPFSRKGRESDEDDEEEDDDTSQRSAPDKWLNPENYVNSRQEYRITPSAYAEYKFLPNLSFKSIIGADYRNSERQMFKSRRLTTDPSGSLAASSTNEYFRWNWDNTINFNKKIASHFIQATLGSSATKNCTTTQHVQGWNIEQYKASMASINTTGDCSRAYSESEQQTLSFFARGIYNFRERYVLTATYRIDGSSKFQGANKWSGFPSAAFAWRASEEPWFKIRSISQLKFRLGWGRTGNQSISNYQTMSNFSNIKVDAHNTGNDANYLVGIIPSNLANPSLKWETTEQVNAGIDFGMWKGRLSLSVDAYNKLTYDLLQSKSIATSSGFSTIAINEGTIRNRGLEVTLDATPLKIGNFEWSVDGNISFNRNKIITISEDAATQQVYITPDRLENVVMFEGSEVGSANYIHQTANIYMEGYPMGLFYGYKTKGILQDGETGIPFSDGGDKGTAGQFDYYDLNGNGYLDIYDRTILGDPNPDFTYGFGTALSWKRLSISATFIGSYGNDILNANLAQMTQNSGSMNHNIIRSAYYDAWSTSNPDGKYAALGKGRTDDYKIFSDLWIEDGSYLRLASLNVNYDIKMKRTSKVLKGLSLGFSAQNLVVWTKYSGWDPDVNSYGTNVKKMGIDNGAYPSARTFSFDLKLKF